ncbi:MAG: hypothetical protein FJ207_10145 [Gemmatimonadetes bacterium]|nr:hypothetical protein [Gemmatimonadota bacterium]
MTAYFTMVHMATFALLSLGISYLCRRSRLVEGHPVVISSVVFGILTAAIIAGDLTLMPGIVAALGVVNVLLANALTGVAMAAFFRWSHRPERYAGPTAT